MLELLHGSLGDILRQRLRSSCVFQLSFLQKGELRGKAMKVYCLEFVRNREKSFMLLFFFFGGEHSKLCTEVSLLVGLGVNMGC